MTYRKIVMLTENNLEREYNVCDMRSKISGLEVKTANLSNVWSVFLDCFRATLDVDGLLLLEDDAQLCANFAKRADRQIQAEGGRVISFFERPLSKKPLSTGYYPGREFGFGLCNFFPSRICAELAKLETEAAFRKYWPARHEKWTYPNDIYIRWVLQRMNESYYMEIPFLVQHRPYKSTLGARSMCRQTRYFADDMEGDDENQD